MFDRSVDEKDHNIPPGAVPLPLHLIALVISHLDQPGDLARACRTCRVLHYMTLPQLYSNVSLHSYDYIRYSPTDGRPEGCGGPSPFFMGLNALITRNVAGYVKSFRVYGAWKENDLEECAKVGRIPDGNMMLTTLIRAAIDRMPLLESFSWELNTKMLPTVWLGLVQRPNLQSLTVRFPQSRLPGPMLVVPPMPKLKWLKVTDIDPLCYPDDISLLLMGSKELRHLKMHWSRRMLESQEPSTTLHSYFGRSMTAGYKLPLVSLAFQNLFTQHDSTLHTLLDLRIAELTMISGAGDTAALSFVDYGWRTASPKPIYTLKMIRGDKISRMLCNTLGKIQGLERYYLITGRKLKSREIDHSTGSTPVSHCKSDHAIQTPITPVTPPDPGTVTLGPDYLDNIFKNHGSTLRHLLLMPQWRLSSEDLARLVHSCPNLEQLGLGLEIPDFKMLRLLIPFLPRLYALRILDNSDDDYLTDKLIAMGHTTQELCLGEEALARNWQRLRWVGVGDFVFEVFHTMLEIEGEGQIEYRRKVKRQPIGVVRDVEIWSMDRLEL